MATASISFSLLPKTLTTSHKPPTIIPLPFFHHHPTPTTTLLLSLSCPHLFQHHHPRNRAHMVRAAAVDGEFSTMNRGIGGGGDKDGEKKKETIMLPGCDYNHWLIVMEFPKDPAPSREEMIDTYLHTLASVLGSMEEAKKNMYAFSTTTYTGFQCTIDEETSEKFKGLPGVLWVLPDSYIDVKNKDYGGDKYINGEIIPAKYPTYQPKQRNSSKYENRKYENRRYERRRDGPPRSTKPTQQGAPSESTST